MLFETLENRQLMSGSPLTIPCSTGVDQVVVKVNANVLNVSVNGVVKASTNLNAVSKLIIDTKGGGDCIQFSNVNIPVCLQANANVLLNLPTGCGSGNTLVDLGIDANVLAKLNLGNGLKLSASANVDACIGLLTKLKIGTGGILCSSTGAKVDVNACLGLLAHVGVQTNVTADVSACLNVCAALGIKSTGLLGLHLSLDADLNSCVSQLASIGLNLELGLHLHLGILGL